MSLLPVGAIPLSVSGVSAYNLTKSLRFKGVNSRLSRTNSVAGANAPWTFSTWVKRGKLGALQYIYAGGTGTVSYIAFDSSDRLTVVSNSIAIFTTTDVFRDPSAWYHIVVRKEGTTSGTWTLYVNGVTIATGTGDAGSGNGLNATGITYIGSGTSNYFDGYLADTQLVSGTALAATSFGETDATTGVWKPIDYTGSYGSANGFHLTYTDTNVTPTYVNTATALQNTASTTITVNVPTGTATGDLLILTVISGSATWTTPAGWTVWLASANNRAIYYKTASSEPASYTVTQNSTTTASACMLAYRNAAIDVMGTITAGNTSPNTADAITTTANNAIVFNYVAGNTGSLSFSTPAGYTSLASDSDTTSPSYNLFYTIQTTAGGTGTVTTTFGSGNARSTLFSIKPITTGLGIDSSGLGTLWTTTNISLTAGTTYDSMTDVPTLTSATDANYCVLNPINTLTTATTAQNGNLSFATTTTAGNTAVGSIGMSSGKWYWEAETSAQTTTSRAGVYGTAASAVYSFAANNTVYGFRFNADAGTLDYTTDGSSFTSLATGLTSGPYFPYFFSSSNISRTISVNFGQRPFTYTPPTGYVRLNTYNLPDSTIKKGNAYMDATLYTGTGASRTITNAGAFRPDLVWVKTRSVVENHNWADSVRGSDKYIFSNLTDAESTGVVQKVTSFNSNGFGLGTNTSTNASGTTFVAWQWQAGQGSTSSNTNGSVTSTVSVNATAGFSIITWTGTGTDPTSIGHGLGVAPKVIIIKNRSSAQAFIVATTIVDGSYDVLALNSTAVKVDVTQSSPTSTVFTLGTSAAVNGSGNSMIAYAWAEIAGFSKFANYTGNGSTNGPFVYTGFRPKFVMVKRSDNVTAANWYMEDSSRNTSNPTGLDLQANLTNAEANNSPVFDFLSNGFKLRTTLVGSNASGGNYIYMAFAETPFKNSLAR
jgi:hypothetical protein